MAGSEAQTRPEPPDRLTGERREQWRAARDELYDRGPVAINFGPVDLGVVNTYPMDPAADRRLLRALGEVVIEPGERVTSSVVGPDLAWAEGLPRGLFASLTVLGADDGTASTLGRTDVAAGVWLGPGDEHSDIGVDVPRGGGLSDAGVRALAAATKLQSVHVCGTFTDEAIAELTRLSDLKQLHLDSDELTGAGLGCFAGTQLLTLAVCSERVSLDAITSLPEKLIMLNLTGPAALELAPESLAGLDGIVPVGTAITLSSGSEPEPDLAELIPLHQALPGRSINGLELTAAAIAKVLKR